MGINQSQAGAIYRAVQLAERYQREGRQDIVDRFKGGNSLMTIARQERTSNDQGHLSESIVERAVTLYLKGYNGKLKGSRPFEGAMDLSEYQRISREHMSDSGRERGRLNILKGADFTN